MIYSVFFSSQSSIQIEFTAISPAVVIQDSIMSTAVLVPTNQTSSTSSLNICMMCVNNSTSHENSYLTTQTDFADIKSLASRLIVAIHTDEVEKKLLRSSSLLDFFFCFSFFQ